MVCAAPSYLAQKGTPRSPEDLKDHDCLSFNFNFRRSRIGWPFREKGHDLEIGISGSMQVNNGMTMRQMVLAGVGMGRLGTCTSKMILSGRSCQLLEKVNPGDLEMLSAV